MASVLVFAGSNRKNAYSGQLAAAAVQELTRQGAEVTQISLKDYPLPIMDQDLEAEEGIPENAYKLA
ncbi:NAD(P)H-dependent oxidoreductase, partial [Ochrobactrum sp. SFR4]